MFVHVCESQSFLSYVCTYVHRRNVFDRQRLQVVASDQKWLPSDHKWDRLVVMKTSSPPSLFVVWLFSTARACFLSSFIIYAMLASIISAHGCWLVAPFPPTATQHALVAYFVPDPVVFESVLAHFFRMMIDCYQACEACFRSGLSLCSNSFPDCLILRLLHGSPSFGMQYVLRTIC